MIKNIKECLKKVKLLKLKPGKYKFRITRKNVLSPHCRKIKSVDVEKKMIRSARIYPGLLTNYAGNGR